MTTPGSSSIPSPSKLSLVCTLINVYNLYSFKLNVDGYRYKLWHQIFFNMCRGTLCYGPISGRSIPTGEDDEEWFSVDNCIKSWFYSSCDPRLLKTIYSDDCTAKDLCDKLDKFLGTIKCLACCSYKIKFAILTKVQVQSPSFVTCSTILYIYHTC